MNINKNIFCVIPAYNEEKTIGNVIDGVKKYIDEIIVVDDGSIDNTEKICRQKKINFLKHLLNRGQGAALQTGNELAIQKGAQVVVHFDADGQFFAEEISELISPILKNKADIVFGSRFLGKKSNIPTSKRILILPIAKIINKFLFGIRLSDPQSGFRAMGPEALKKIKIQNDGSSHCNEIMAKAYKYKLKIAEAPITVEYKQFGQSLFGGKGRGAGGFKILKDIFLAKFIN